MQTGNLERIVFKQKHKSFALFGVESNHNSNLFIQLIQAPQAMDIDAINDLIRQYPYFNALWFIKAKNAFLNKNKNASTYFQQAALLSAKSNILSQYIAQDVLTDTPIPLKNLEDQEINLKSLDEEDSNHAPSLYHDNSLPYSFLWWLNKTRLDYKDNYQPYTDKKEEPLNPMHEGDPLDQQFKEHIFHIQDPELKLSDTIIKKADSVKTKRKADPIVEKFIQEEPQIKAPSPEKVSSENKARKSAIDESGFVSETLARIYTEQGLIHKAIDTYKKLSLKFPEKSLYFANLIEQLEKQN